jgi:ABC-type Fe3+-hydroxamate transport system substrate-binding protein
MGRLRNEGTWLTLFLCIGLAGLALLRPLPRIPPPVRSRTVVDAQGRRLRIAEPFRGIAFAPNTFLHWYLEDTHAPDLLIYIGGRRDPKSFNEKVANRVYPWLLERPALWRNQLFGNSTNPYTELESLLAFDPGVYIGVGGPEQLMRNIGLPVFNDRVGPRSVESGIVAARADASLVGNPELAEARIAAYHRTNDGLLNELRLSTLTERRRVAAMNASTRERAISVIYGPGGEYDKLYFPRAGVVSAAMGRASENVERFLAIDPDVVFLLGNGETPREFMNDARWVGLKAVRGRRVYRDPANPAWVPSGITFRPVEVRFFAEFAYPERLRPRLRQLLSERMFDEFGYRLNDDEIDSILHVDDNSFSADADRLRRNYTGASK